MFFLGCLIFCEILLFQLNCFKFSESVIKFLLILGENIDYFFSCILLEECFINSFFDYNLVKEFFLKKQL